MARNEARGYMGSGDLLINPFDPVTGLQTGWVRASDSSKFGIKANSQILERVSKGRNTSGQVLATVARQQPADLAITFAEVTGDALRLAFMGTFGTINQGAGNIVDEAATFKGAAGIKLSKENIVDASVVLTSSDNVTTYAIGTHYTVNYRLGLIFPVKGSALATAIAGAGAGGLAVKVDFAYAAISGQKIKGATNPSLRTEVLFDGKNDADGLPMIVRVWEAVLTPNAEFDFLQDNWNDVQLQGRMNTPSGKEAPFEVEMPDYA